MMIISKQLTLGSLFDGSGTCPLAASLCGIKPIWASEIEKFPIQVTSKRFPNMKHLGDITKINGAEIEPVDIITFGSPCQGLSLAGKQLGLIDERSNLFHEAIRIIREMRKATNNEYPRYIMWENVPGAFSSNKGSDFKQVLEEITETEVPMPQGGKWATSGMVELPDRQLAWRVLDAQHWGVPQRRKRIFLIADFAGKCAGEILFKPESLLGNIETSGKEGKGIAANLEGGINIASGFGETGIGYWQNGIQTLRTEGENRPSRPSNVMVSGFMAGQGAKAGGIGYKEELSPMLKSTNSGGNTIPSIVTYDARGNGDGNICCTITGDHQNRITDYTALAIQQNASGEVRESDIAYTLNTNSNPSGRNAPLVYGFCPDNSITAGGVACEEEKSATLSTTKRLGAVLASGKSATGTLMANCSTKLWLGNQEAFSGDYSIIQNKQVRRLTPTECARLQGFPDWWCSDIEHSDTAEYKMWGNGMALPCVLYIMQNMTRLLHTNNTLIW